MVKIIFITLMLISSVATAEPKIVDHSTNVPDERYRVGISDLSMNLGSTLSIGTHPIWWTFSFPSKRLSPNFYAKGTFDLGPISISPFARFYYFDFKELSTSANELNIKVAPLGITTSVGFGDWDFQLETEFIAVFGVAIGKLREEFLDSALFSNTARVRLSVEWMMSSKLSLWAYVTSQVYQGPISGAVFVELSDGSTVRVRGELSFGDLGVPTMGAFGAAWRWGALNLRLGAGYGRIFVPDLGLATPFTLPFPEVDLYFRF